MAYPKNQALFNLYIDYLDHWARGNQYIEPLTGQKLDAKALHGRIREIEGNTFVYPNHRMEVLLFVARHKATHHGQMPSYLETPWKDMINNANKNSLTALFTAKVDHNGDTERDLLEIFRTTGANTYWKDDHNSYKVELTLAQAEIISKRHPLTLGG